MKSLSFRHSNTYIFLRHTSCACAICDTPETVASTATSTARLRSCKRKHSSSFGWPKANSLCGCSAVRIKEIFLSAKRFDAGLTSQRKAGLSVKGLTWPTSELDSERLMLLCLLSRKKAVALRSFQLGIHKTAIQNVLHERLRLHAYEILLEIKPTVRY